MRTTIRSFLFAAQMGSVPELCAVCSVGTALRGRYMLVCANQRERMDPMTRTISALAAACVPLCAMTTAAAAWPERNVTLIVPFAAGGITDVLARITGERLQTRLGKPFIVENVVGATGTIAAARVAKADPDGHVLFFATVTQIALAPFTHKLSYDPIADFAPISVVATSPFVITVGEKVPAKTLPDLVALVKAKPDQFTYGSAGAGSLSHLAAAIFTRSADLKMGHVPYRGVGPAFQDLVAGHIAMMAPSPVELKPFLEKGTVKPLAVMDTKRSKMVPGVPAIGEFIKSPAVVTWNGIMAPAKTPKAVIDLVSKEIMAANKDAAFLARLDQIGVEPVVHTPADFVKSIADDTVMWGGIIKALDIKAAQ